MIKSTLSTIKAPVSITNELDKISRGFWWGHGRGEKKLRMLNWDKLCTRKAKGEVSGFGR